MHQDSTTINYTYWGSYTDVYDEQNNATQLVYQTFGSPSEKWLTSVIDALSSSSTYSYNAIGSLLQTTQSGTLAMQTQQPGTPLIRTFNYNTNNFLTSEQAPDRGLIQYMRDYVGNILTKGDGMGTTSYTYDALNRLALTSTDSGITIAYTYDNDDNRMTTSYSAPSVAPINYAYTYDQTNKLTQKAEQIGPNVFTTKYTYDPDDNLTDIYYPSSSNRHIQYSYNANNQVTSVPGFVNSINYYTAGTTLGLPYQYTYANGDTITLSYNVRNQTTGIAAGASAVNMAYEYDWIGNTILITNNLNHYEDEALGYDALNRLAEFNGMWGQGLFTYDAVGNRLSKKLGATTSLITDMMRITGFRLPRPKVWIHHTDTILTAI